MDYEKLASELLRALRGKRSQVALMRRLGYTANAPYLWEAGRRYPPARVLFRLAALNRVQLEPLAAFAGMTRAALPSAAAWDAGHTGAWLSRLVGETPIVEVARTVQSDRTTVGRWLRGTTEPRVPELLAFADRMTHRLVELVSLFVEPESLSSLRGLARDLAVQRRIAYELPWSHAVLRALELDAYARAAAPGTELLAAAIGIGAREVEQLLGELQAARLVRRRAGKWLPVRVLTVDTRARPEQDRQLKLHSARVALERLQHSPLPGEAFFSYNLFGVSHEDYARLRDLHLEYFERLRRIVAESSCAERVVVLNQQLVPLDV